MNRMIWPFGGLHFLQYRLQTLFKLAAKLRPRDQRAHIQRYNALFFQALRHIAAHNSLCETFYDGGFADSRLADQNRIVFRPARKHLDHATDLVVSPNHRIQLPLRCKLRQVAAVFFQRLIGRLGILRGHPLAAANILQRPHQPIARDSKFSKQLSRRAGIIRESEQHMLHRRKFILQPLGLFFGLRHQLGKPLRYVDLVRSSGRSGHFGQPVHFLLDPRPQAVHFDIRFIEDGRSQSALLLQQGEQQVLNLNLLVPMLNRNGLSGPDRFLHFFSESIEIHSRLMV